MSEAISVHHGDFGRAAVYKLSKSMSTHAHREGHLIFYISKGTASVGVGSESYPIDKAQAVAVSPWESHRFEFGELSTPCLCLVLYIKPTWFSDAGEYADNGMRFGRPDIRLTPEISRWVTRLTDQLMDRDFSDEFDHDLFAVTQLCYEHSWTGAEDRSSIELSNTNFSDYRVRRSLKLMRETFADEVEIDWLAREAGLSRPHFFKLFKKQMGITPNLYLNTLRAEQAIEDLMSSEKSVTEISYDLGFSSQASFTRFFSSNVGIPPSDYRRVAHVA